MKRETGKKRDSVFTTTCFEYMTVLNNIAHTQFDFHKSESDEIRKALYRHYQCAVIIIMFLKG